MNSSTSHAIKHREEAKDVFYTPLSVVKKHLSTIQSNPTDKWLDPFAGKHIYYDNFPTANKELCELTEGTNFFEYKKPVDIIVTNPPYSCIDEVLEHSVSLTPRVISYLLLEGKMTPKRIEYMNKKGYSMTGMYMCKVYKWYGMACAYTFTKTPTIQNTVQFEYDRIVHKE